MATNLLDNAVKFSPEGTEIQIQVERSRDPVEEKPGRWVKASIADQGVGIDEKYFQIIFDRFAQISSNALNDKPNGTGLGLSICKEIITHYGGRIGLMSKKGKGCTFFFTLPAAAVS